MLRILRDAEKPLSVAQIYASVEERDKFREAQGVRSKRHMKGLLRWMRSIRRVYALPAKKAFEEDIVSLRASGKGHHVFKLTEKGEKHIAKIDANAGIERPAAADGSRVPWDQEVGSGGQVCACADRGGAERGGFRFRDLSFSTIFHGVQLH